MEITESEFSQNLIENIQKLTRKPLVQIKTAQLSKILSHKRVNMTGCGTFLFNFFFALNLLLPRVKYLSVLAYQ